METLPEQMSWLDSAPLSQQVEDLREMTTRIAAGVAGTQAASMFDAWQIGDERAIFDAQRASHADDSTFEAARRVLLLERNRIWADRLAAVEPKTGCAVLAVGVLHLIGEDSLLARLEAAGFRIHRVSKWEVKP